MKKAKLKILICIILSIISVGCNKIASNNPEPNINDEISSNDNTPADVMGNKDGSIDKDVFPEDEPDDKDDNNDVKLEKEPKEYFDTDDNLKYELFADLNGDGDEERIQIFFPYVPFGGYYDYTLKINDIKGNFWGDVVEPQFNIVDIDKNDNYKEVAVSEYGPSDDTQTTFYRYDGETIKDIGTIQGFYGFMPLWDITGNVIIDGSGIIKTASRGEILQTWFYDDEFQLDANGTLQRIPKDLYDMNTEVTALMDITLRKSRTDNSDGITIKSGEKIVIKESDNKKWCSVVNKGGEVGWFEVYDYSIIKGLELPASQIFEGLCFAD